MILLRCRIFAVAGIGPSSIFTGSQPTDVWSTIRARGVSPSASAFSRAISRTAAAPSEICDELPAVMRPSGLKAGLSCESFSSDVSGRMPWSAVKPLIGAISRANQPLSVAWAALRWESTASWSSSERGISHCSAISSAPIPWPRTL